MLQCALRVGVHMYVNVLTHTNFHCQLYGAHTKHRSHEREAESTAGLGPKHCPCLREVPNHLQTLGCSSQLRTGSPTRRSSTMVGMHAPVKFAKYEKSQRNHPSSLPGNHGYQTRPRWQLTELYFRGLYLVTFALLCPRC